MKHLGDCLDCNAARERLYEFLDRELTQDVERQVREHLDRCAICFKHYQFELTFKRFLKTRAKVQGAPENLRRKIFDRLLGASENGHGDLPPP